MSDYESPTVRWVPDEDVDVELERWRAKMSTDRSHRRRAEDRRARRRRRRMAVGALLIVTAAVMALLIFGPLELLHLQI